MSSQEPRVLIVESNDALRAMLFTVLRYQPISVDTAATADDALRKVRVCDYALIMVDLDMEHEAGLRFVEAFREERPEAPTFVLAVRNPRDSDTYLDAELISAVLTKPLEIDTLAEVVRECALVVPPPAEPLPCPPSESDIRTRMQRGPYVAN
jgi:two-component system response regulator GlrR